MSGATGGGLGAAAWAEVAGGGAGLDGFVPGGFVGLLSECSGGKVEKCESRAEVERHGT